MSGGRSAILAFAKTGSVSLTQVVIVQLHKGLSDEDKTKFLEEIKGKGAQIVKDDNKDSSSEL